MFNLPQKIEIFWRNWISGISQSYVFCRKRYISTSAARNVPYCCRLVIIDALEAIIRLADVLVEKLQAISSPWAEWVDHRQSWDNLTGLKQVDIRTRGTSCGSGRWPFSCPWVGHQARPWLSEHRILGVLLRWASGNPAHSDRTENGKMALPRRQTYREIQIGNRGGSSRVLEHCGESYVGCRI